MNGMLVSIITPSFNSQDYISETIDSVINQTYKNWEMIIVDDCSTDKSYEIIKKYAKKDSRIKIYQLKHNSGCPAVPRNYALSKSHGKYIAFLDSDDIWHTQKLELQLGYMLANNSLFTASEIKIFHNINEIKAKINQKLDINMLNTKTIDYDRLIFKNIIPNSSVILEKKLLNKMKFNEDLRYKAIEDYHMWLRILENNFICEKINFQLLFYRLAETSISKSKFSMFKKHYMLYNEYLHRGKSLGLKKFLYLCSYIYFSIINKLIKKRV